MHIQSVIFLLHGDGVILELFFILMEVMAKTITG